MTRLAFFCGIAAFALPAAASAASAATTAAAAVAEVVEEPTRFLAPVAAEATSSNNDVPSSELEEDNEVYFGLENGAVVISVPPSMEGYGIKPGAGLVPIDDSGAVKRELCSGHHCYKVKHRHQKHYRKHKKHHKHHHHVKCLVPGKKAPPPPHKKAAPPPHKKGSFPAPPPHKKGAPPPMIYAAPPRMQVAPPPQKHQPIPMRYAAPPTKKGGSSISSISSYSSGSFRQEQAPDVSNLLERSMSNPQQYQQQMPQGPIMYA